MVNVTTTTTNLRKATWKNVRQCLIDASITDVDSRIYASYPIKNINLPLIIVENGIKGEDEMFAIDKTSLTKSINIPITLCCKQAEKIDSMADEIEAAITAYIDTFDNYELYFDMILDGDSSKFLDVNENKVHSKTITAVFELK